MRRLALKIMIFCGIFEIGNTLLAASLKDFNLKFPHVPAELIVKFRTGFASHGQAAILGIGGREIYVFKSQGAKLVQFSGAMSDTDLLAKARELANDPSVEYVEANTLYFADSKIPNDPKFIETYGLHNDGSKGGKVDADIDAPEAWEISTGSKKVLVGIIDTGVDYNHDDLKKNYWQNPGETGRDSAGHLKESNGIDDDHNGFVDDFRGWDFVNNDNDPLDDNNHGSHVAGTIGGSGNDGIGVAGVNWDVSFVGIKFLNNTGSGSLENAVKAIEYATTLRVSLTSNSWGGGSYSKTMEDAIAAAGQAGILFVAAAGNDGRNNDLRPHYPGGYSSTNVISVGATDRNDAIAPFSNFGKDSVHIFAPGVDIVSTTKDNTYSTFSGTSMATPHVSGVIALMMAVYPRLSGLEVKARLFKTAEPISSLFEKSTTGARINAFNALENDMTAPGKVSALSLISSGMMSVEVQWSAAGDDGQEGVAARYVVRRSNSRINTMEEWSAAQPVSVATRTESGVIVAHVSDLPFNSSGFLTVRAVDNVGNEGPLSTSLAYSVLSAKVVFKSNGDSLDGLDAKAPWGTEEARNGNFSFSDSPKGQYGMNLNIALTLPEINRHGNNFILAFEQKYQLETTFDFGFVELSTDSGGSWKKIASYTGTVDWQNIRIDLRNFLKDDSEHFKLRFRITTDASIPKDGWYLDNVGVYAPSTFE